MLSAITLAIRYMAYHRLRTVLLWAAITLTFMLPLATRWTIERFRNQSLRRAESTPMIVGAKGSSFGLTFHALYFRGDSPPAITYRERMRLDDYGLGQTLPILARFRTSGHVIVGVTDDYLKFRKLTLTAGEPLERWGDCLVGWQAARELNTKVDDRLLSEPENMLDLSAAGPLKLRVRGILERTGEADDSAIFCHLETAWIMAGIGHGHNQPGDTNPNVSSNQSDAVPVDEHSHAAENLERYTEITEESLKGFHFHGQKATYPLSAILVLPDSDRSAALIEGKYLRDDEVCQVIVPSKVVSDLLQVVAKVEQLLNAISMLLGAATLLLMTLVMWLSLRLRAAEIRTLRLIGAGRWKIAQIMFAELALIASSSLVAALALSSLLVYNLDALWLVVTN